MLNNSRNSNHLPYCSCWSWPGNALAGQELFKCCYKALWNFPSQNATRTFKFPLTLCLTNIYKNLGKLVTSHIQVYTSVLLNANDLVFPPTN